MRAFETPKGEIKQHLVFLPDRFIKVMRRNRQKKQTVEVFRERNRSSCIVKCRTPAFFFYTCTILSFQLVVFSQVKTTPHVFPFFYFIGC